MLLRLVYDSYVFVTCSTVFPRWFFDYFVHYLCSNQQKISSLIRIWWTIFQRYWSNLDQKSYVFDLNVQNFDENMSQVFVLWVVQWSKALVKNSQSFEQNFDQIVIKKLVYWSKTIFLIYFFCCNKSINVFSSNCRIIIYSNCSLLLS